MGAFNASGSPPPTAEQIEKSFKQTVVLSTSATADTWAPGSNHMGVTTSATLVSGVAGKRIYLTDVVATYNAIITAQTAFSFTLAEEGSTSDILRMSVNGGGPGKWKGLYRLPVDADLVAFLGQLQATYVGSITVTYVQM